MLDCDYWPGHFVSIGVDTGQNTFKDSSSQVLSEPRGHCPSCAPQVLASAPLSRHLSPMAASREWTRLSFQEALELVKLSDESSGSQKCVKRFMSRQPAWEPGKELPWDSLGLAPPKITRGAYGAVVYAQSSLAAARVVEQEDHEEGNGVNGNKRGIHVSRFVSRSRPSLTKSSPSTQSSPTQGALIVPSFSTCLKFIQVDRSQLV